MFGVVSTGTSSIAIDLTYDKKRMDEAIKKIAGSALKPSEIIEGPQGPERAQRAEVPRARRVFDRVRHRQQPVESAESPEGGHLRQQRLRLQPV